MLYDLTRFIEGANAPVTTASGKVTKRIYLNNAATALALKPVLNAVNANIPFLTYIDAPGPLGGRNTRMYENVRAIILDYMGGTPGKDTVVYVKNSTEAINLLSWLFYQEDPEQVVITTAMEHMANYLPFKSRFNAILAAVTRDGDLDLTDLENKLEVYKNKVKLVAVTGASNVSGIMPPVYKIAKLAHRYGAKILVDAVQLIQHRPFSMRPHDSDEHIDFIAFSAHKCYTPFDGGALIGSRDFLEKYLPFLDGAGTTKFISSEKIIFSGPPKRYEAGYPDLFGILAMGEAFKFLKGVGPENIEGYEKKLYSYATSRMKALPKVRMYGQNSKEVNVPFISFTVEGRNPAEVAKYLAFEHGIEVGAGTLGADIYVHALLGVSPQEAYRRYADGKPVGVVRISLGMYNTFAEIDALVNALQYL